MSSEHSPIADADGKSTKIDPRDFNLWQATYSVKEARKEISCGHTQLYELIATGELHPTKRGRRTILLAADLARHLAKLQAEAAAPWPGRRKPDKGKAARPHAKPGKRQHEAEARDPA
jgi:hypothetical protein